MSEDTFLDKRCKKMECHTGSGNTIIMTVDYFAFSLGGSDAVVLMKLCTHVEEGHLYCKLEHNTGSMK